MTMGKLLRSRMQKRIKEQDERERKLVEMKTVSNISQGKIKMLELKTKSKEEAKNIDDHM